MRSLARSVRASLTRATERHRSRDELHDYWRTAGGGNAPEVYADQGHERSAFLVELLQRHAPGASVIEIGCNAGRNLEHLRQAGFTQLAGIEISQRAVDVLDNTYPEVAAMADIRVGPVEQLVRDIPDRAYGLAFTMAVLEHVHDDSAWVFGEIARIASTVVTIEDEQSYSWRHFPRHYGRIFTSLGLTEVERVSPVPGANGAFVARVFRSG